MKKPEPSHYVLTQDLRLPFVYGNVTFTPIDQGIYSNLWHDRLLPNGLTAKIVLAKPKRRLARDMFSVNAGFVGTERLAGLLKAPNVNTDLRTHPCDVYYHDNEPADGTFYFLEFNSWVDAFDYTNSAYTTSDGTTRHDGSGTIESCSKLRIVESKTQALDLFFLEHVGFFDPIVSHKLADILSNSGIDGVKLIPIEEYSWSE